MRTTKVCNECHTKPSVAQCMVCGTELCKYHVKRSGQDAFCLDHYKLTNKGRGVAKIL